MTIDFTPKLINVKKLLDGGPFGLLRINSERDDSKG